MTHQFIQCDVATGIPLPDSSVQCVVTSPPYFGLRDYGIDGQLGLEKTPDEYVAKLVDVFREVHRVLKGDGVVWLNLGDSYAANRSYQVADNKHTDVGNTKSSRVPLGFKPKDLLGIPWRVALALQADGWWLRSDIIWSKPNPMPESVTDRPTRAHEYLFLLTKSARYYYDADAIKEPVSESTLKRFGTTTPTRKNPSKQGLAVGSVRGEQCLGSPNGVKNKRSVWNITTQPYKGAHFATFPKKLVEPCVLAGSRSGDTVLDPFSGSGTTVLVAKEHGRIGIGLELNPKYIQLAEERLAK